MANEMVLIVDDDPEILQLVQYNVEQYGMQPLPAETGAEALEKARTRIPDLIVLDLMLPDIDGFAVCRALKSDAMTRTSPIIMLTAKGEENDVIAGLELGAVDYVVKPFSPRVLLARIRATLREEEDTTESLQGKRHNAGPIWLDPETREAWVDNIQVALSFTEFELLHHMIKHPDRVYTRSQLMNAIHGEDYPTTERTIDVQVVGLRKKLGNAGEHIETVRGVGYRFRR